MGKFIIYELYLNKAVKQNRPLISKLRKNELIEEIKAIFNLNGLCFVK